MMSPTTALRDADHRLVLDALTLLTVGSDSGEDLGRKSLRVLRSVIDCDVAALNDVDPSREHAVFVSEPVDFPVAEDARDVLAELAAQHPLLRHTKETGDRSARRLSDVTSSEAFHASELYRRLYAPMGIEHQMAITLDLPLPAVVAVTVSRRAEDFTDRERDLMNLLSPHLANAWRHYSTVARLSAEAASRTASIVAARAVVLSEPVRELTAGTLRELERFFGRPSARTGVPVRVEEWLSSGAGSLIGVAGGHHALLRRLPAEPGQSTVLLLYADSATEPTTSRSLGLTVRETEVLTYLATGRTNAEMGAGLHISAGTVKKHLDNVYAKLGVRGRLQAVTLALELGLRRVEDPDRR